MPALEKVQRFNYIFMRATWVFLTIGLVDHFSCELDATEFACEFLPHSIARFNLDLLWIMIGVVIIGEITAWFLKWKKAQRS